MASDTRDRLVRSTTRLLRTQGYAATGLNQIMAEADAPKGSMYFHFPGGKTELAAAAVDRFAERSTSRMQRYLADNDSVAEAVVAIFDDYVTHLEKTSFSEGCAVANVALDAASTHATLAEATGRAMRRWVDVLAEALEAEGRTTDAAHGLATLVIACIEGTVVMARGEQSSEPIATTREMLRAVLAR